MRDVFPDETAEGRSSPEFASNDTEAARIRDGLEAQQVCPFCGAVGDGSESLCPKCAMENNAAARKATKLRIGPWYVLQNRNPAAPGMKWETLLSFVRKGRVKPQSVVRGPTTHQLWRFAAHVKGLSREFGVCYSCGGSMERGGNLCPHCNRLQEPPINPDTLLEGSEGEGRAAIYREIPVAEAPVAAERQTPQLDAELLEKLRRADEVLNERHEKNEAADRLRAELDREREAAAREREAVQREKETIAREREGVIRDKEAIERDRLALARDREAARRERELRGMTNDRPPDAAEKHAPAPRTDTAVWDLGDPAPRAEPLAAAPRKPAPPVEKPASGGGSSKRPPRDGGFLSAKDLAAAFKLNHQMALAARELKGDEDSGKGDDASARFKPGGAGSRRASRHTGRKLFLALVVLVWVVVLALVFHPSWRTPAMNLWLKISRPSNAAVPSTAPAGGSHEPEKSDEPPAVTPDAAPEGLAPNAVPSDLPPSTLPSVPQTAPAEASAPSPATAPIAPPANTADPAPVRPAPPVGQTVPPATPLPAPVPAPAVPETAPAAPLPNGSPPATESPPAASPNAQAKNLYRRAIEAEVRGDIAEAAGLYAEIQKLPPDSWPSDLELRLKLAKAQLKQR